MAKSFIEFVLLKEEAEQQKIEIGFDQLKKRIEDMFNSLIRAAQRTWGNKTPQAVPLPVPQEAQQAKNSAVDQLNRLRRPRKSITGSSGLSRMPPGENLPQEARIYRNIINLLNEAERTFNSPDWLKSQPRQQPSASGRPVFGMRDVLNNIRDEILRNVENLKQSVGGEIKQMLADFIKNQGSETEKTRQLIAQGHAGTKELGGKVSELGANVQGGFDKLGSKMSQRPFNPSETENASKMIGAVIEMLKRLGNGVKLLHVRTGEEIPVKNALYRAPALGSKMDRMFAIKFDPEEIKNRIENLTHNRDAVMQELESAKQEVMDNPRMTDKETNIKDVEKEFYVRINGINKTLKKLDKLIKTDDSIDFNLGDPDGTYAAIQKAEDIFGYYPSYTVGRPNKRKLKVRQKDLKGMEDNPEVPKNKNIEARYTSQPDEKGGIVAQQFKSFPPGQQQ